eukprot:1514117-Pyramimonas_sp.AAC.4
MTPLLVLLLLSPPGQPLPEDGIPDRGGVPIVDRGSGMQHVCGVSASHVAPGGGVELIKLFEDEEMVDEALPLALRAVFRSASIPDLAEYGAHANQSSFVRQKAGKYMIMLGPRVADTHPGWTMRYCTIAQYQ